MANEALPDSHTHGCRVLIVHGLWVYDARDVRGVRYVSLAENSGYGLSGRDYISALLEQGIPLQWFPLIQTTQGYQPWYAVDGSREWLEARFEPRLLAAVGRNLDYDINILHCVPEYWPQHLQREKRNVGYTVWETDRLPPHWCALLEQTDCLLVPCRFNVSVFEDSGIGRPITVIPHIATPPTPVASELIDAVARRYDIPDTHFVFYATDVWNPRKAPWSTMHAYQRAFTGDDRVSFVFKTSATGPRSAVDVGNRSTAALVDEILAGYPNPAHVVLIRDELPGEDIEALHARGDCYLSLTRSEGWGLGAFRAAAHGNPVIITGWGGHLDYLTPEWPYLVDFALTPVMHAQGRHSYQPTQQWASPSVAHAVTLMHEVYREPARARAHGMALAERVQEAFSERVIARRLLDVLQS